MRQRPGDNRVLLIPVMAAATALLLFYAHRSRLEAALPKQILDEDGQPVAYSMNIISRISVYNQNRIIRVQMHWDALGRYTHYELPKGKELLKKDDKPFTEDDYKKLHSILNDRNSPLRNNPILPSTGKPGGNIDAVTAATPKTLQQAVVAGAAYTCYNLWHRANGDIVNTIMRLTADALTTSTLHSWLQSHDDDKILFALSGVYRQKLHDKQTIELVMKTMQSGHSKRIDAGLPYLKQALPQDNDYYAHLASYFTNAASQGRVYLLSILAERKDIYPSDFYEMLTAALPNMTTYYEVHLLLKLAEDHGAVSPLIQERTAALFEHENFFVARRAMWFLEKQELSAPLNEKVEAFRKKNTDRL